MECSQSTGMRPALQPGNNLPHTVTGDAALGAHTTQPPSAVLSSTFWALHQQGLKAPQGKSSDLPVAGR